MQNLMYLRVIYRNVVSYTSLLLLCRIVMVTILFM